MDIPTKSKLGCETSFPTSSIKIENKEEVIDSNIPNSYDDGQNNNDNSILTSTPNTTNHFLPVYSGSEMSCSDVFETNHVAHVKMEVFVDHTYNAFQEANNDCSVSTGLYKDCISSNYSSSASAGSPKVEDHVKTENCEVRINVNMIKSEPDTRYCDQTVHSASENIYLENPSTCFNQHIGTSEVQATSADPLAYSSNRMFLPCRDWEKPIKMEPVENPEDLTDNNIEDLCNTPQNNYAVHVNDQNGVVYPESKINALTKMEVDTEMECNNDGVSDLCTSGQFADEENEESPLSANPETNVRTMNLGSCQFNLHLSSRSEEGSFCCEQCGKVFKKSWDLKNHAVSHSEDRPFSCEHCGKTFKRRKELYGHSLTHSEERPFSCELCGKAVKRRKELYSHILTHSKETPFSCEQCGKAFKTRGKLKRHEKSHSEEKPFSCEQCGKTFKTSGYLKTHLLIHSEDRPFSCEQCGKKFKTKREVRSHMISHSEEKPFSCGQCGKRFKTKGEVRSHMISHSEERPFSCERCGKAFKTRGELRDHEKIHSEERPFSCEHCEKAFKTRDKLKKHVTTHSQEKCFMCEHCGKTFKTGWNLNCHLTGVHAEQRRFICEHCGKSFMWRSKLNSHLATHAKEKLLSCEHCAETFKQWAQLELTEDQCLADCVGKLSKHVGI